MARLNGSTNRKQSPGTRIQKYQPLLSINRNHALNHRFKNGCQQVNRCTRSTTGTLQMNMPEFQR